jgi:hypothetical protein
MGLIGSVRNRSLALDIKDRTDALDRCERQRRDDRRLPAHLDRDISQQEELAPAMRPTQPP